MLGNTQLAGIIFTVVVAFMAATKDNHLAEIAPAGVLARIARANRPRRNVITAQIKSSCRRYSPRYLPGDLPLAPCPRLTLEYRSP